MRSVFKHAENMGASCYCNLNTITIKSVQIPRKSLSEKEQKILIKYLLNDPDYTKLGILICVFTGIRIGELCALKFDDISLPDKIINIRKTMQRVQNPDTNSSQKTVVNITSPKSPCSIREIPLPDCIVKIIDNMNYSKNDFILTGMSTCFVEPRTLQNRFKKFLTECNIPDLNFHQLRHRFATHCVELGFEIKSLSEILGHSNVNITLNRYVHSSLEIKRKNITVTFNNGILTFTGTGDMPNPDSESYWDYRVDRDLITKVVIGEGITSVCSDAFWNMTNLKEVTLPTSLNTINEGAFYNCWNLAQISFPEGLKTIESNAFTGCKPLDSVKFPKSLTKIGTFAFYGCNISDINIPDSLLSQGGKTSSKVCSSNLEIRI